jgi:hypothetical protein
MCLRSSVRVSAAAVGLLGLWLSHGNAPIVGAGPPPRPPVTAGPEVVDIYHSDPGHLWNRLYAAFHVRIGPDGRAYGRDEIDPLLWAESTSFDADRSEGIAPQLASVEYVPSMGGFLVLTATVSADNAFHGNILWLVNNGTPRQARSYATFEPAMKAGGLAVLGVEATGHRTTIKLLITYDNDPHVTRIPSRFQTALLVHDRT